MTLLANLILKMFADDPEPVSEVDLSEADILILERFRQQVLAEKSAKKGEIDMPKNSEEKKAVLAIYRTNFVAFLEAAFAEIYPSTRFLHNWHIKRSRMGAAAVARRQRREFDRQSPSTPS